MRCCSCALQTTRYDARYPGTVRVEYVFHPLYGETFKVVSRRPYGVEFYYELERGDSSSMILAWMTEPDRCLAMTWGPDPVCSLTSLLHLHELLRSTGL